jgi:hypothetical protein
VVHANGINNTFFIAEVDPELSEIEILYKDKCRPNDTVLYIQGSTLSDEYLFPTGQTLRPARRDWSDEIFDLLADSPKRIFP